MLSFAGVGTAGPILLFLIAPYVQTQTCDFMLAEFVMPHGIAWFYVIGMGIFATISQVLMTKAYSQTNAGIVGVASYTSILFAIFVGVMLGDSLPTLLASFGIVLIILSGLMVAKEK